MPQKPQYYTIVFEKFIDLITESERLHFMLIQQIKEYVGDITLEDWDVSPLPDFIDTEAVLRTLRQFLDKKINNPPEEEIKFAAENNIKDVLLTAEELAHLQSLVITMEEQKELLKQQYSFEYLVN
jgi:hypothetical protein